MKNKIKEYKILSLLISFLFYFVYIYGAYSLADWVVENVGTSPTSSFYGLVTLIVALVIFSIQNSIQRSSSASVEEKKKINN